jgi:hypothetical protein
VLVLSAPPSTTAEASCGQVLSVVSMSTSDAAKREDIVSSPMIFITIGTLS